MIEELQRVDIKLSKDCLKWAGAEASYLGVSRRQFLADIIEHNFLGSKIDGYNIPRNTAPITIAQKAKFMPEIIASLLLNYIFTVVIYIEQHLFYSLEIKHEHEDR